MQYANERKIFLVVFKEKHGIDKQGFQNNKVSHNDGKIILWYIFRCEPVSKEPVNKMNRLKSNGLPNIYLNSSY